MRGGASGVGAPVALQEASPALDPTAGSADFKQGDRARPLNQGNGADFVVYVNTAQAWCFLT